MGTAISSARYERSRSPPMAEPPSPLTTILLIFEIGNFTFAAPPMATASSTCRGKFRIRERIPDGSYCAISSGVIRFLSLIVALLRTFFVGNVILAMGCRAPAALHARQEILSLLQQWKISSLSRQS